MNLQRISIEGKFDYGKNGYQINNIRAKLANYFKHASTAYRMDTLDIGFYLMSNARHEDRATHNQR
ncbi:MAG: hypothetical protein OXE78_01140, partial [Gammaproteobacteria bacterium]|nr:hypothetical protein [Gammaproteobacteria bacterium]